MFSFLCIMNKDMITHSNERTYNTVFSYLDIHNMTLMYHFLERKSQSSLMTSVKFGNFFTRHKMTEL